MVATPSRYISLKSLGRGQILDIPKGYQIEKGDGKSNFGNLILSFFFFKFFVFIIFKIFL